MLHLPSNINKALFKDLLLQVTQDQLNASQILQTLFVAKTLAIMDVSTTLE